MEKSMEKEYITINQVENIKDSGWMIKNMVMELYNMQMVIDTKVIGKMDKDTNKAYINIVTEMFMMDNGSLI